MSKLYVSTRDKQVFFILSFKGFHSKAFIQKFFHLRLLANPSRIGDNHHIERGRQGRRVKDHPGRTP